MEYQWTLAHPLYDVDDIVALAQRLFDLEGMTVLKADPYIFRQQLTLATTYQVFDKSREFIAIARDTEGKLGGYCWFDRSGYTTYSREEISNAKFHHVSPDLPLITRVKLILSMIDQHILWCQKWGIPIICSTSIRTEHDGFMKIHKKRGFTVNGSYAWIRTENAHV